MQLLLSIPVTLADTQRLLESLRSLPWGLHAVVAMTLIAGLVLWSSGRSVLKPVIALGSAAAGAIGGFFVLPVLAPAAGVSPYLGSLGGAIVGLLAGLLLYRIALALSIGIAAATASALIAAAVLSAPLPQLGGGSSAPSVAHHQSTEIPAAAATEPPAHETTDPADWSDGPASEDPPAPQAPKETPRESPKEPAHEPGKSPKHLEPTDLVIPAEAAEAATRARAFADALIEQSSQSWRALTATQQIVIAASALIGLLLGGLLGVTLPEWSAGALTAMLGAAIWIPAAVWLAHAAKLPVVAAFDLPPTGWAVVWLVVGLVGLGAQWMGLMRKSGKKAKAG